MGSYIVICAKVSSLLSSLAIPPRRLMDVAYFGWWMSYKKRSGWLVGIGYTGRLGHWKGEPASQAERKEGEKEQVDF